MTGLCGWALGERSANPAEARSLLKGMSQTLNRAGGEAVSLVAGGAGCFVRSWRQEPRAVE